MPEITTDPMLLAVTAVLAYLLGSIPFGVVITRAMGLGDLRQIGSGNIGATNVLRTGNKAAALATLVLDAAKGGIAVLIARWLLGEDAAQLAGLSAFLGHLFPVWLRFRGGKGVATLLGILIALAWPVGLAACATWLVTALISRTSSVAALVSAGTTSLWLFLLDEGRMLFLVMILTILVYVRHAENLKRIKAGTEPKIGQKKPADGGAAT
jgi:glycerol-3-phosphate acyltransferase PlsY